MTVSSTNTKNSYSGDGSTTVFTYNFPINSQAERAVISRSSLGTETTKTLNSIIQLLTMEHQEAL